MVLFNWDFTSGLYRTGPETVPGLNSRCFSRAPTDGWSRSLHSYSTCKQYSDAILL